MADVFISYAREDRARAEQVAHALERMNISVFWDSEIPPGKTWADYIEEKLSKCKAVVVLWSANSTKSQWVREEARMGRDRGTLIPALLDNSQAPFGFGEVQAANLASWSGNHDHPEWRRFTEAVVAATGAPATAPRPLASNPTSSTTSGWSAPPASAPKKSNGPPLALIIGGTVVGLLVILGVIGAMVGGGGGSQQSYTQVDTTTPPPGQTTVQQQQAGGPDPSAQASYGNVELAGGFLPDPYLVNLQSGGPIDAAATMGGPCRGFINAAPDVQLTYQAAGAALVISVNSNVDTTLVVNGPDGQWYCDDDSGNAGSNPAIAFNPGQAGIYDIWVGTYGAAELQPAQLAISETNSF